MHGYACLHFEAEARCRLFEPRSEMSDKNENKLGWIYIKQLLSNCQNEESFNKALKEFPVDSSENRLAVAKSLLEIGIDRSESAFKRNYVLSHLSTFIRTCDLQNDFRLQE